MHALACTILHDYVRPNSRVAGITHKHVSNGLRWLAQCRGKYYAMNVPLKDGIDDQSYAALFKPVMSKLIEVYQPQAVVFQSGVCIFSLLTQAHFCSAL